MNSRRRGGRGSNQYATKPGGAPLAVVDRAVVTAAIDAAADDVAWVFHPDRDAWAAVGFGREDAELWLSGGGTLSEAAEHYDCYDGYFAKQEAAAQERGRACGYVLFVSNETTASLTIARSGTAIMGALTAHVDEHWASEVGDALGPKPVSDRLRVWRYTDHVEGTELVAVSAEPTDLETLAAPEPTVLALEHSNGSVSYMIGKQPDAQQFLEDYVDEWWGRELGEYVQPGDPAVAVAEYFENVDGENYTIAQATWMS